MVSRRLPAKRVPEPMMTTGEVGRFLNVSPQFLRTEGHRGKIVFYRIGPRGDRRYFMSDVMAYVKQVRGNL